jgi:hypothetical protein
MASPSNGVDANPNSATHAAAVTKSDATVLTATRALYVGGDGDLVVEMMGDGAEVTFPGVLGGTVLPIRVVKVKAATTATNVVALW